MLIMDTSLAKINLKIIIKYSITAIFIICFIYQTTELMSEYMSGRTVINIKYGRESNESIPGITICYPCYLSMEGAIQLNPKLGSVFRDYKTLNNDNVSLKNSQADKLNKLYLEIYENITNSHSIFDLMDKFSIPFNISSDKELKPFINVTAFGFVRTSDTLGIDYISHTDVNPIESFAFIREIHIPCISKCFTFFSSLNQKWQGLNFALNYMLIEIEHDQNWFPISIFERSGKSMYFSLHSRNILPELMKGENFVEIDSQNVYIISFSQIHIHLLKGSPEANCRQYNLGHVTKLNAMDQFNLRSDCIGLCVIHQLKNICQIDCIHKSISLMRKGLFNEDDLTFCSDSLLDKDALKCFQNELKLYFKCSEKCENDCKTRYYDWNIQSKKSWPANSTVIAVKHSRLPDQFIRYIPETTFIAFVSNFGGLLGMWLGLSFLTIFDISYKTLLRLLSIIYGQDENSEDKSKIKCKRHKLNSRRVRVIHNQNI